MLTTIVTVAHLFICLLLIGLVLLQQGKGADLGATFGGGSQTVFGASGADTLLTKVTTSLAALFMVTSLTLALYAQRGAVDQGSIFQGEPQSAAPSAPSAPAQPMDDAADATTSADEAAPANNATADSTAPATAEAPAASDEGAPTAETDSAPVSQQ